MQSGNVTPCFSIPDLHQAIFAAASYNSLGRVPVTGLDIPTMACQSALGSACWEVPYLCCTCHNGLSGCTWFCMLGSPISVLHMSHSGLRDDAGCEANAVWGVHVQSEQDDW